MMAVELFGVVAVSSMVIMYALEQRSHVYVLGFAASCAAASLYAVLIHSWPFAVVEGVWAVVAARRWVRVRPLSKRHADDRRTE
jgi:uncharacterized membrane protein YhfC